MRGKVSIGKQDGKTDRTVVRAAGDRARQPFSHISACLRVIIGSIFNVVLRFDGSLNAFLKAIGLVPVDWLGNGATALASLIAVQLWATFGMSLLIFMAGLSTVSKELIEANFASRYPKHAS